MNINTVTIHKVDYFSFENAAIELYGRDPEVIASLETGNDTSHEFSVDGKLDEWDQKDFDSWLSGESSTIDPRIVLNYMARSGNIPTGDYLMWVSW